jgi:membrane-bound lytic murein transglycosylase B
MTLKFKRLTVDVCTALLAAGLLMAQASAQDGHLQTASAAQTSRNFSDSNAGSHKSTSKHVKKRAASNGVPGPAYATRPDAMLAANEIAVQRGLDPQWVAQTIGAAHYMPGIAKAMAPAAVGVPKNWTVYRRRFIDDVRIKAGVKFWTDNRPALERAEQETGVPAEIVVGIIGVETIYGQQTGNYRVIDALTTLTFDFPQSHPRATARAAFFRSELEEYLVLTQRTHTDPLALRGSYAGAMGLPQFMPSSWTKYGIDFDGDGHVDLFNSPADAIGSVANYFKSFQWQRGMPTHYPVAFDPQKLDRAGLLAPDIVPTFTPDDFSAKGAILDADGVKHKGLLALIELQNAADAPQYVAGTENFYAITRYNWSSYYAMAVIELGQEVAAAMPK